MYLHTYRFLPNTDFSIALPILRSNPCLVVGMPVFLAIFCFTALTPTALLSEKDKPGIFIVQYFDAVYLTKKVAIAKRINPTNICHQIKDFSL